MRASSALRLALVAASCLGLATTSLTTHASVVPVEEPTAPVLVSVAGDIACGTTVPAYNSGAGTATQCRQKYTSDLILGSDAVWTLGDHTYPTATDAQLAAVYEPTWGRMKAVTYPTPGDHDYGKIGGSGYFSYFGSAPYYSFDLGGWHVISLDSEIDHSAGSVQLAWLQQDLTSTSATCLAAYWSAPRWTSGPKAPGDTSFDPFWRALYAARVDVVLGGDVHNYERFAKMSPDGTASSDGIREFVVGTGGRSLVGFPNVQPRSQARKKSFGVLQLTLNPSSYDWSFINESRTSLDSGSQTCN